MLIEYRLPGAARGIKLFWSWCEVAGMPALLAWEDDMLVWCGPASTKAGKSEIHARLNRKFPEAKMSDSAGERPDWIEDAWWGSDGARAGLRLYGTPFQHLVWKALLEIPYGTRVTYRDIACAIGAPQAFRAVGNAVGANPVALLVPCHRVVPSSGGTGHYSGGAEVKRRLLHAEAGISKTAL